MAGVELSACGADLKRVKFGKNAQNSLKNGRKAQKGKMMTITGLEIVAFNRHILRDEFVNENEPNSHEMRGVAWSVAAGVKDKIVRFKRAF